MLSHPFESILSYVYTDEIKDPGIQKIIQIGLQNTSANSVAKDCLKVYSMMLKYNDWKMPLTTYISNTDLPNDIINSLSEFKEGYNLDDRLFFSSTIKSK
jgi:hypothetical protein